MSAANTIDVTGVSPDDVAVLRAIVERLLAGRPLMVVDTEMEHKTDGSPCWCGPITERHLNGDVIIHRGKEDAH